MKRKVHIILNPAAGKEEPILSIINKVMRDSAIEWEISLTKKQGDAWYFTKQALRKKVDVIAVYGGDGTVREVAKALYKRSTPLLIIPGGTANVLAKDLGIPIDSQKALRLLTRSNLKTKKIDMGLCNKEPFVVRLELGIPARMINRTTRDAKNSYGELAYIYNGVVEAFHQKKVVFSLTIDEKKIHHKGIAVIVANAGNMGIEGMSLLPKMKINDGKLDIIVIETASMRSLFSWIKIHLFHTKAQQHIHHWKGKEVKVEFIKEELGIVDDEAVREQRYILKVIPNALHVVVS